MIVCTPEHFFKPKNKDMTNAKKHKTKTKSGTFINNMFCAVARAFS